MYIPFPETDIYALTDSRQSLDRPAAEVVRAMLAAGLRVIQYREKDKHAGEMLEECLAIRRLTREAGCCFIVNDHVDIALLCEADGVHVGQEDLPLAAVRRLVGKERIVGVSTHSRAQMEVAVAGGADYIGVGPLYATATKKEARPVGMGYLEEAAAFCPVSVVCIGGINERTAPEVMRHGGRCLAMVSAITLAPDIPARVALLRSVMNTVK